MTNQADPTRVIQHLQNQLAEANTQLAIAMSIIDQQNELLSDGEAADKYEGPEPDPAKK